jgi:hypothetical protein
MHISSDRLPRLTPLPHVPGLATSRTTIVVFSAPSQLCGIVRQNLDTKSKSGQRQENINIFGEQKRMTHLEAVRVHSRLAVERAILDRVVELVLGQHARVHLIDSGSASIHLYLSPSETTHVGGEERVCFLPRMKCPLAAHLERDEAAS